MSNSKPTYQELERRCKDAEAELAITLDNMSDAFVALDENLTVSHFNATASRYLER